MAAVELHSPSVLDYELPVTYPRYLGVTLILPF